MRYVLPDTGFWYGLFDTRDQYHGKARENAIYLNEARVIVPWPILYETLGSHFVRNTRALERFEQTLKSLTPTFLDDTCYRDTAFRLSIASSLNKSRNKSRSLSMVDCAVRLILEDPDVRVDTSLTFNARDFADVCHRKHIELI